MDSSPPFSSRAYVKVPLLCTFLLDLKPTDIKDPLSWFQATTTDEVEVGKLIHDLNDLVGAAGGRALSPKDIDEVFDTFWPRLKGKLERILSVKTKVAPARSPNEMIEETLQIVREIRETVATPKEPPQIKVRRSETDLIRASLDEEVRSGQGVNR